MVRFVWVGGKRHPHLLWRLRFFRWEIWWARPMCFGLRDQQCGNLIASYSAKASTPTWISATRARGILLRQAASPGIWERIWGNLELVGVTGGLFLLIGLVSS